MAMAMAMAEAMAKAAAVAEVPGDSDQAGGSGKPPLLFLCHRIPYPPNKGDKIRAFHLLHHLAGAFEVHLATFVDDPADWAWRGEVEKHCGSAHFARLDPRRAALGSLRGLLTGDALTLPYYHSEQVRRWVRDTVAARDIRHAIVYSSAMAQFLPADAVFHRSVIDFVDIDSDKWLQYAARKRWPLSWIYRREGRCLLRCEQRLARQFDAGLFVSSAEAALFKRLAPETAHKIGYYNNGVNATYFSPEAEHPNPYPAGTLPLVFTGAMDYWPNVDAVVWFCREVFPALREAYPDLTFTIVGGNPAQAVRQLQALPGVAVTGRVADVRPYLKHALAAVAPVRIARGVQNKVLEAMAMALPVLVSSKGLEGIAARDGEQVLLADSLADYQRLLAGLFAGTHASLGQKARVFVQRGFTWEDNLPEVVFLLKNDGVSPRHGREHEPHEQYE